MWADAHTHFTDLFTHRVWTSRFGSMFAVYLETWQIMGLYVGVVLLPHSIACKQHYVHSILPLINDYCKSWCTGNWNILSTLASYLCTCTHAATLMRVCLFLETSLPNLNHWSVQAYVNILRFEQTQWQSLLIKPNVYKGKVNWTRYTHAKIR